MIKVALTDNKERVELAVTDIRLMSSDELTELTQRGREWRAKNSPDPAAKKEPVRHDVVQVDKKSTVTEKVTKDLGMDERHSVKITELERFRTTRVRILVR
jgi:hypothetical protein